MSGYTKLFNSILASTVWSEPNEVRIVWITMLAMANKDGVVEGSVPGLAVFARLSIEDTRHALDRLSAPDQDSRSKELDGRRIETVEGGWKLVNHFKYRQQMSADERREYLRIKQQEHRAKQRKLSTSVNNVSDKSTKLTHTAPAPYTAPDPDLDSTNKPDRKAVASTTSTAAAQKPTSTTSSSKHPIHRGQRFTVFDWMLDDIAQMLGPAYSDFGLDLFFDQLDRRAAAENVVLPKKEVWPWLQAQVLAEAQSRGMSIVAATPEKLGRAGILAEAVASIRREG